MAASQIKATFRGLEYVFLDAPVSGVLEQLKCPICLQLPAEPVSTSCRHLFCEDCIKTLTSCPLCRRTEGFTASPDGKIAQVVHHLRVKCPNSAEGCEWQGQLGDAREHLGKDCQQHTDCCHYGCGERMESRSQLEEHIGDHCPNRPFQCEHCGYRGVHSSSSAHYTTCQHFPLPCPGKCNDKRFTRKSLKHHLSTECPEEEVRCKCAVLCFYYVLRRQMNDHLAKHSHHSDCEELSTLKEFCLSPSDAMPDLSFLPLSFRPWLWTKLSCYRLPPWVIALRGFKEINEFDSHIWHSYPLFSHYGGYGMYLIIYPCGDDEGEGTHVSVYASLIKGDNDDNLKFPFKGTITVSLLNQEEDRNHLTRDLWSPQDNVPEDVRGRVTSGVSSEFMWGVPRFISREDLGYRDGSAKKSTYLKNDTLFLRVDKFEPAF